MQVQTDIADNLADYVAKKDFPFTPDCPISEAELSHIFKNRNSNGFADAFSRVSARNFLLHVPTFIEVLNSKRGL